ncbi:hypothetical protein HDU98_000436 [Podochytrium sp. JEL0797]|nr:hypothetical protein HDU98_000436 [Podochytrium sp. JEL0797]
MPPNNDLSDRTDSGFMTSFQDMRKDSHYSHERAVHRIPSELLLQMFGQVPVATLRECALVNRWFHFAAASLIWQRPRFASLADFAKFASLCAKRVSTSVHLRHLVLKSGAQGNSPLLGDFVSPLQLAFVAQAAPFELVEIDLTGCWHVSDAALAQLLVISAPSLQILNLTNCRQITEQGGLLIAGFCQEWKRLRKLWLRGCGLIGDATLVELGKTCASFLESLDVSQCPRISDRGIFRFLDRAVRKRKVFGRSHSVEEIQNPQTDYDIRMDRDDVGLLIQERSKAAEVKGTLKEFRFSGNQSISRKFTRLELERVLECLMKGHDICSLEFSIPVLLKNGLTIPYKSLPIALFKNVTSLHIHNASNLHEASILTLSETIGAKLQTLTLTPTSHCSTQTMLSLFSSLSIVKNLYVPDSRVDGAVLSHLIRSCECISSLEVLDIGNTRTVTDLSLFPLFLVLSSSTLGADPIPPLPQLHTLVLAGCSNVTFDGIFPLIHTYANAKLQVLDITSTSIDTKSWPKFVRQCEELERAGDAAVAKLEAWEDFVPEFAGVEEGSLDKEYVLGNLGDGSEEQDVWVPRRRTIANLMRDGDDEIPAFLREEEDEVREPDEGEAERNDEAVFEGVNSGKVFLLKEARCAVVLRRKLLCAIAKHGRTVLGDVI